ncbi:hypothetical protein FQZ97_1060050 [compost metagenome]
MSRFTASSGRQLLQRDSARGAIRPGWRRSAPRVSARPISAPHHSATTAALAAPATPQSSPSTNHSAKAMLVRLVASRIASGARAFWVPRNQPTSA